MSGNIQGLLGSFGGTQLIELVGTELTQNSAVGNTLTINIPTGVQDGDLLLAFMDVQNNSTYTWTGATGWTEAIDSIGTKGGRVAYKIASSEGASATFTANTASYKLSGAIVAYRYAQWDAIGAGTGGASPIVCPSVTAASNASVLLSFFAASNATVSFAASGMTSLLAEESAVNGPSWHIFYELVNAGATGTRTGTITGSASGSCGVSLVIKPI